jgi:xanthine/uracil permease
MQRFPLVLMRLVGFIGCWIAAFALLPTVWVGVALALYAPVAISGIRRIYTTFAVEVAD